MRNSSSNVEGTIPATQASGNAAGPRWELGPKRTNRVELGLHSGQAARHKIRLRGERAAARKSASSRALLTADKQGGDGAWCGAPRFETPSVSSTANRYGRGHAQVNGTPVLAAIDVWDKPCRLLIAVPEYDAEQGQMLVPRVIDSFTANVRLGESLERTGTITVAALDRTIAALKECAKRLKKRRVTHVKAIATEACRKAKNAQDLVTRAEEEAGIHLCIVTPEEEARLAAAGCVQLIGAEFDGALIFDIGGGSTELILVKRTAVNGSPSVTTSSRGAQHPWAW